MASAHAPALRRPPAAIVPERLESCIRRLEPADRALLDLSLNRGIPDWALAPILRADPTRLAWKRARAIERVASRMGLTDPADLPAVREALTALPDRAWLPLELQPAPVPARLEPPEPPGEIAVIRPTRRAASSTIGGLSERAKRAYPRGTMKTRARRAAGALALGGAAALLALRRR
ncbi:MAG TPA: hypothetical protein VF712_13640 [Thermoleophilaceae bacterium]|jgi:hypothetical protein